MLAQQEILALLARLDEVPADALEGQDLDFKEWDNHSKHGALDQAVEMAVCMANGGGGTVIFGVRDKVVGRAQAIEGPPEALISPAAMEILREVARQENAPGDLLTKTDLDLLGTLEVIVGGRLTRAGVFLGGSDKAIERHLPNYLWTHLRMVSDTDYQDRADGRQALAQALTRLEDRINADNPITTVEHGLYHFEYRA